MSRDLRLLLVPAFTLGLAVTGCTLEPQTCMDCDIPEDPRGRVISDVVIDTFTTQELIARLDDESPLISAAAGVEFPVDVHQVVYETIDPKGLPTEASGIVAVPSDALHDMALLSFQHGTQFKIDDAPSVNENGERIVGLAFAGAGYLTAVPDYLGLGQAAIDNALPLHPYVHADSEATATIDLMRAARTIALDGGFSLSGDIFLGGYSQGGHATMATAKAIGTSATLTEEFRIKGAAPMAGPYDVSGVQMEVVINDAPYPEPSYLPYIILAWDEVYDLFDSPDEILAEPYASTVPDLFDGTHSGWEINDAVTEIPNGILEPAFLAAFRAGEPSALRDAMEAQDLTDWSPTFPVRMYHCEGDNVVLYENAEVAQAAFEKTTSTTEIVSVGAALGHVDCALPTFLDFKTWLDDIARGPAT